MAKKLVQDMIDGTQETVYAEPEWKNLKVSLNRFKGWGKEVLDDIESILGRLSIWTPGSLRDAGEALKTAKKAIKTAGTVKEGWEECIDRYADWRQASIAPAKYQKVLVDLLTLARDRVEKLQEDLLNLEIEEARFQAMVEGRW